MAREAAEGSAKKLVLVVEDDADTRDMLRDALEYEGYAVSTAANGREGLDTLSGSARPCLILLDLMMPVMDGFEFLDHLHRRGEETRPPVLVVSAYHDMAAAARGAVGVIEKPVRLARLLESVREFCGPAA